MSSLCSFLSFEWLSGVEIIDSCLINLLGDVSLQLHGWGQDIILNGEWIQDKLELLGSLQRVEFVGCAKFTNIRIHVISKALVIEGSLFDWLSISLTPLFEFYFIHDGDQDGVVVK